MLAPVLSSGTDGSYLLRYSDTSNSVQKIIKNTIFLWDSEHPDWPFPESRIWQEVGGSDGMIYTQNNVYGDFKIFHGVQSVFHLDKNTYPTQATHKDPWPVMWPDLSMIPPAAQSFDTDNQFVKCTSVPPINPRKLFIGAIDFILEKWYQKGHPGDPAYLLRTNQNSFWYDDDHNLIKIQSEEL